MSFNIYREYPAVFADPYKNGSTEIKLKACFILKIMVNLSHILIVKMDHLAAYLTLHVKMSVAAVILSCILIKTAVISGILGLDKLTFGR